jgi:hypothetical protein
MAEVIKDDKFQRGEGRKEGRKKRGISRPTGSVVLVRVGVLRPSHYNLFKPISSGGFFYHLSQKYKPAAKLQPIKSVIKCYPVGHFVQTT